MHAIRFLLILALCFCLAGPAVAVFDSAIFNAGTGPLELLAINPAGEEVAPSRQLVLRFNRPVVPVGRMERDASEIPVTIEPPLACEWRWLDTSNLACQLGEKEAMKPATSYTVTLRPGIKTEDGATLAKTVTHNFATMRPRLADYDFVTWRSPSLPVIQLRFNQPVDAASVARHFYFATAHQSRLAVKVSEAANRPPLSLWVDGEKAAEVESVPPLTGELWYVSPEEELPLDTKAELRIEPGVKAAGGPEPGIEQRTVVTFDTFPDFAFLGLTCNTNDGKVLTFAPRQLPKTGQLCSPHNQVTLRFSAPVAPAILQSGIKIIPPKELDAEVPWQEEGGDYALGQPHRAGSDYALTMPLWFEPYQPFTITAAATEIRDVFDRPLPQDIRQMFFTDHYLPSYDFDHHVSVLEKGVGSEVPIDIRNIERIDLSGTALTVRGKVEEVKHSLVFSEERDKGFHVPLDLRKLLGVSSGAVTGIFETVPPTNVGYPRDREFFVQVTPFNLQVKIGHFNTLVWVTDYATGQPVAGARIRLYRAPWPGLVIDPEVLAGGTSDMNGLATLPGTEQLDPQLADLDVSRWESDSLVVRCDKGEDLAILPLSYDFVSGNKYSDYYEEGGYDGVYSQMRRKYGHIHAWGTTAQGVYRAGDTIQFKLYLRNQDNRAFVPPPQAKYSLKVIDPMDQTAYEVEDLALSEFGAYHGEFTVPANAPVGWYQFELTSDFGGEWSPMRVLVSDFTPSPFKVTTELNGELFRAGETVKVATHARLHAGGPYADAGSRITALLTPTSMSFKHPLTRDFEFDSWSGNSETQTVHQGEETLDAAGDLATSFRLDAAQVLYGHLTVESAVRDDRGKYVASETSARFVGRTRFVGLRQPDWIVQQGKPARIETIVVDEQGDPVAGTKVKVTVKVRETFASRVKGAGNAYLTRYEHRWIDLASFDLTPGTTPANATFTPDRPGYYEITATIKDTAGREHSTAIERWGAGSGAVLWEGGTAIP